MNFILIVVLYSYPTFEETIAVVVLVVASFSMAGMVVFARPYPAASL